MITKTIQLDNEKLFLEKKINPENRFRRIDHKRFAISNDSSKSLEASVVINFFDGNNAQKVFTIISGELWLEVIKFLNENANKRIQYFKIEINEDSIGKSNFEIEFALYFGNEFISVESPSLTFLEHLKDPINTKVLFSAPFGQGKSTFLNYFFEKNQNYEVFKVYPVNYSVASNDDIFKYIKADILFQLILKNKQFDKFNLSTINAFEEYVFLNKTKSIVLCLKTFFALNKGAFPFLQLQEGLQQIFKEIEDYYNNVLKYQKGQSFNNENDAKLYIDELYNQEGSIFEDNFYTEIIRNILLKNNENSGKQSVLIIEDLDRMDPDHIFRILNVISAHYDSQYYDGFFEFSNKYGFDKIILVCDYSNIENIFHHRYGERTDFHGYINKYYSSKPYYYDNQKMVDSVINDLMSSNQNSSGIDKFSLDLYTLLLKIFINSEFLKLRELLKILDYKIETIHFRPTIKSYSDFNSIQAVSNLRKALSKDILKKKVENLSIDSIEFINSGRLEHCIKELFFPFSRRLNSESNDRTYIVEINNKNVSFEAVSTFRGISIDELKYHEDGARFHLKKEHFIEFLRKTLNLIDGLEEIY